MSLLPWIAAYLALGAFAGFFAGLLGIGGGLVLVPLLAMIFAAQGGFPADIVLRMALGTSMAAIIFTAIASLRTHHAHGAVLWRFVFAVTPGILVGTGLGTLVAGAIPVHWLAIVFSAFVCLVAIQMTFDLRPGAGRELPGVAGILVTGLVIGMISALVAIGGGSLTVPFLTWCRVRIQEAIGTSAAVGLPIAIGGTVGYMVNGWGVAGLPAASLGYVYVPALVLVVAASTLTAPRGARLAHRLPVATLRRIFASLLVVLAAKMLWSVLAG